MGITEINKKMDDIYVYSDSELKEFEIWPDYFKLRYEEFKKFYSIFPKQNFNNTLEIACGIGYQASFLGCISNTVIASDVDFGDMIQHSRGLDIARKFIKQVGAKNVEIANANAEHLPFQDEQFDFIYCSYSLQCMPDMANALKEISRVLKSDGYFFCTLPTPLFTLRGAGIYYKGVLKKIFQGPLSKESTNATVKADNNNKALPKRKWYAKLLPPSEHKNFLNELFVFSTGSWKRLFENNGHQVISKKYSAFKTGNVPGNFFRNIQEKMSSEGIILITQKKV